MFECFRYSIVSGNEDGVFRLDPESGKLLVAKESDVGMHYSFDVIVTDGKYTDRCIIKVDVKKSDNSGLVFAKDRYYASVLENSTKSDVIVVTFGKGDTNIFVDIRRWRQLIFEAWVRVPKIFKTLLK